MLERYLNIKRRNRKEWGTVVVRKILKLKRRRRRLNRVADEGSLRRRRGLCCMRSKREGLNLG